MDRALSAARDILDAVRTGGDADLLAATERFDGVRPATLILRRPEMREALETLGRDLRESLEAAAARIEAFHRMQLPLGYDLSSATDGLRVGEQPRALDRVGVYVPAGPSGYPSTALMGTIPARLAGVREIVLATPPAKTGRPPDAVLAAAWLGGATEVLVAGGAQAIAALAYGTESVRPVDKIVGPGNVYVTAAKLLVQDRVATDGIAGPSEVLVVADDEASPDDVATELLAQAEHDSDAVAIGVVVGDSMGDVRRAIESRARGLRRGAAALRALDRNGWLVRVASMSDAIDLSNRLAPEHLVLAVRDASAYVYAVRDAGCVFLGPRTTAALGDYVAGTNHVLPTAGSARWRGGLGVRDFVKFLSFVEAAPEASPRLRGSAARIARAEGFEAHAAALEARERGGKEGPP
jgi:histidinol dehydrogenase